MTNHLGKYFVREKRNGKLKYEDNSDTYGKIVKVFKPQYVKIIFYTVSNVW